MQKSVHKSVQKDSLIAVVTTKNRSNDIMHCAVTGMVWQSTECSDGPYSYGFMVMTHIAMVSIMMVYIMMANIVMAYIVMDYIGMAYIVKSI